MRMKEDPERYNVLGMSCKCQLTFHYDHHECHLMLPDGLESYADVLADLIGWPPLFVV